MDIVVGVEARGFIFALRPWPTVWAPVSFRCASPKAAGQTAKVSYQLEYGTDTLEIHEDAIRNGPERALER